MRFNASSVKGIQYVSQKKKQRAFYTSIIVITVASVFERAGNMRVDIVCVKGGVNACVVKTVLLECVSQVYLGNWYKVEWSVIT